MCVLKFWEKSGFLDIEGRKNFLINVLFFLTIALLIILSFKLMFAYLLPFIIGLCIAFFARKVSRQFEDKLSVKTDTLAALITVVLYVVVICMVFLIIWGVVSFIIKKSPDYISHLSGAFENTKQNLNNVFQKFSGVTGDIIGGSLDNFLSRISGLLSSVATNTVKNMPQFFISSIVTITASFYIAKDYNKLLKFLKSIIKPKTYVNILTVKNILVECVFKMCSGYLILSLITFVILIVGLNAIGVKQAFGLAILISVIDVLPVIGAGIVLVPWSVISFFNADFKIGFGVFALYIVCIVFRNVLEPKIISKKIGINPLLTLITIFLGFKIAGFIGMIILPIALIITINFYKIQIKDDITNGS